MKYSQSMPSLPTLDASSDLPSTCSNNEFVLGCLKIGTQEESVQQEFHSAELVQEPGRSVGFSTVEVRSHAMILGDNPSVSSGPPVTLDWTHQDVMECDLSQYEKSKPLRRSKSEICIPSYLRESWLRDQGYARSELTEVSKEIDMIKKGRDAVIRQMMRPSLFSIICRGRV